MAILKLEPFSGLSGDMFLGLFANLGGFYDELKTLPKLLKLEDELHIEFSEKVKTGIACTHVKIVDLQEKHRHNHAHHHHHHRHLKDVNAIIDKSDLDDATKERAKAIFLEIGKAEADVHGTSLEKIHFHEVGAIDSIADVVGAAWLIEKLGITKTYCETVNTGFGFVNTEHGRLPVPAPATQKLLTGMPTEKGEIKSEMVTPTGAAILKNLKPSFTIPALSEEKIGYGPGEKDFKIPNVLRGSICSESKENKKVYCVECNLDDSNGEYLGNEFRQLLLDKGALEVVVYPVLMKKSRPGNVVQVLCNTSDLDSVCDSILEITSGIGLRYYPVERKVLNRTFVDVQTKWGLVQLKEVVLPSGKVSAKPESDQVMKIAMNSNLNPEKVKQIIIKEYENQKS